MTNLKKFIVYKYTINKIILVLKTGAEGFDFNGGRPKRIENSVSRLSHVFSNGERISINHDHSQACQYAKKVSYE